MSILSIKQGVGGMVAYGRRKRLNKLHPHDKCSICGEFMHISKSHERFLARQEIDMRTTEEKEAGYPPGWGEAYGTQYDPRFP